MFRSSTWVTSICWKILFVISFCFYNLGHWIVEFLWISSILPLAIICSTSGLGSRLNPSVPLFWGVEETVYICSLPWRLSKICLNLWVSLCIIFCKNGTQERFYKDFKGIWTIAGYFLYFFLPFWNRIVVSALLKCVLK